jgi:hypothetical protein
MSSYAPIGASFAPGQDPNQQQQGSQGVPLQEAIRLLALRLPRVFGAQAVSPGALLSGPGGSALGNPLAALVLQSLMPAMGQEPPSPQQASPSPGPTAGPMPGGKVKPAGLPGGMPGGPPMPGPGPMMPSAPMGPPPAAFVPMPKINVIPNQPPPPGGGGGFAKGGPFGY